MKIAAWGNSLAVRIPKCVAESLKLRSGMRLNVRTLDNGAILLTPSEHVSAATLTAMPVEKPPKKPVW